LSWAELTSANVTGAPGKVAHTSWPEVAASVNCQPLPTGPPRSCPSVGGSLTTTLTVALSDWPPSSITAMTAGNPPSGEPLSYTCWKLSEPSALTWHSEMSTSSKSPVPCQSAKTGTVSESSGVLRRTVKVTASPKTTGPSLEALRMCGAVSWAVTWKEPSVVSPLLSVTRTSRSYSP